MGVASSKLSLRPLDYLIRFPKKFLVKLCFVTFLIFLKFCSLFKISAPKNHPKNNHRSLEEGVASGKFTFTVSNTC